MVYSHVTSQHNNNSSDSTTMQTDRRLFLIADLMNAGMNLIIEGYDNNNNKEEYQKLISVNI